MSARPVKALAIPRVVSVGNGKGGTGKTSVSANMAGLAASNGFKTLLIDFDPQGNLRHDLGFEADDGLALRSALETGAALPVTAGVRENLDVVKGGPRLRDITALMVSSGRGGDALPRLFHQALSAVVEPYDLIVIDTPPGDVQLVKAAFAVSTAVVITTSSDMASLDGVALTADHFVDVHSGANPDLELAGIALFGVGTQSRKIERRARTTLQQRLPGMEDRVFLTRIRHAEAAAVDARERGLLIHELEPLVDQAYRARFDALRAGKRGDQVGFHASRVDGVAGDYAALTAEVLDRIMEIEAGQEARA